jgi:hypothetical protein
LFNVFVFVADQKDVLCFEEKEGDLFSVGENVSLAHCVSTDFDMSKGIAVEFKNRFGRVEELLSHRKLLFFLQIFRGGILLVSMSCCIQTRHHPKF